MPIMEVDHRAHSGPWPPYKTTEQKETGIWSSLKHIFLFTDLKERTIAFVAQRQPPKGTMVSPEKATHLQRRNNYRNHKKYNNTNTNQSSSKFIHLPQSKSNGKLLGINRSRSVREKRQRTKFPHDIGQGVKRKRDGKVIKTRRDVGRADTMNDVVLGREARSNANNSKGYRKSIGKKSTTSDGSDKMPDTITLYTTPRPLPMMPGASLPAQVPGHSPGYFPQPHMRFGNPSLMQGTSALHRQPIAQMPFPTQMPFPEAQVPPCAQGFPIPAHRQPTVHHGENGHLPGAHQQPLHNKSPRHYSYKPLCQEYPPAYACGRWHRLLMQEEAKRNGIVALLNVMFCCCCNIEPEVQEARLPQTSR